MARKPNKKRVCYDPEVIFFKPAGVRMVDLEVVIISREELEALRLKYCEDFNQEEAATKMNISQSTFHRVLNSTLKKVSNAIVNGKAIKIEGGHFEFHDTDE
jgi:predicted DNA-binding protein (UPF0251 family)